MKVLVEKLLVLGFWPSRTRIEVSLIAIRQDVWNVEGVEGPTTSQPESVKTSALPGLPRTKYLCDEFWTNSYEQFTSLRMHIFCKVTCHLYCRIQSANTCQLKIFLYLK